MTKRFSRLIDGTRAIEARLAEVFETAARTAVKPAATQPLEIIERAIEEIARHVHSAGRGRVVFAFNQVAVTFAAATPEAEARFAALCEGPPSFGDRLLRRLASLGCHEPRFDVHVAFVPAAGGDWTNPQYAIALARKTAAPPVVELPVAASQRVELIVTHGTAERGAYTFNEFPITIGRGIEVRDQRQLLLRVNHVAFVEGADEVTQSVSRRHARIERDAASGRFRVIDDNSAQGTTIVRGGRGITVPRGSRGLALQSGDEIYVGQARLRVHI